MKFLVAVLFVLLSVQYAAAAEKFSVNLGGRKFSFEAEDNVTAREIFDKVPLNLKMMRYAEHEYYSELSFKPDFNSEKTSHIEAGHLYYWDGWNSFVINYEEYDISPYKVVHIGKFDEAEEICALLRDADASVNVTVEKEK